MIDLTDDPWASIDVSDWSVEGIEASGSAGAQWLFEPEPTGSPSRWLHKNTQIPDSRIEQGEDWSEVVSTQIGRLLHVPCATARLCVRHGRRGSISRSVIPSGWDLNEGLVWLDAHPAVHGYVPHREGQPAQLPLDPELVRPGHHLVNIRTALEGVLPPPEGDVGGLTGFDVFVGYLLLDAVIANRDRHEENWAVLSPGIGSQPDRLSPSYDHATSLGFNLTDAARQRILHRPGGLAAFARKGTAHRFEHPRHAARTLISVAEEGLTMCTPSGREFWNARLAAVDLQPVLTALEERRVPVMSPLAVTFASELLQLNLRRLRDVQPSRS